MFLEYKIKYMGLFGGDGGGDEEKGGFTDANLLKGDNAKRVVDEEAGVIIYAVADGQGNGHGYGLTAIPIEETDLEIEESG
jgi:hypothetical protein